VQPADWYAQRLAVELVDDVEGAKASAAPKRVGHEVAAPVLVGFMGLIQGLFDARRQALLAAPRQVELELAVHAPQHRLAPGLSLVTGAVVEQAEAMPRVHRDVLVDEVDHPGVVTLGSSVAQRRAGNAADIAGLTLAEPVVIDQGLHELRATRRGQSFRSTTSFKAVCIRASSAYMRLRRVFSSCSSRSCARLETFMRKRSINHALEHRAMS